MTFIAKGGVEGFGSAVYSLVSNTLNNSLQRQTVLIYVLWACCHFYRLSKLLTHWMSSKHFNICHGKSRCLLLRGQYCFWRRKFVQNKKILFSSQSGFYTQAELTGHHWHWLPAIKLTLNLIVASHASPTPKLAQIQLLMVDRHAFSLCL